MDTNRIKRFATEARNILKAGIAAKITSLGFDKQGDVAEENKPQLMQGGSLWKGQIQTESFFHQWMSLYLRIQQIGIKEVYEEAAYTWFNRLCAIRILQKNSLCQPVLTYADAARTPVIVDEARQGRLPQMSEEDRKRLMEYLDDDTKVTEQFAILVTAWCHDNPIMQQCFGGMADYTELLLPNNILAEGGFVDLLNHTDFITDEDFHSPELIGWLYQFYISERKDEVFAKKGKFEADEIPAATQIFTPNWIVKYMVQNTIGRIYLDNNPYEKQVQKKWKYLVGGAVSHCTINNNTENLCCGETPQLLYNELTDLKVADLACGSGHILNECFDLLYDLYIIEGYGRGEAIENIFRHNLTGIDLDTRAKQLAMFSLLLKACQKDNAFADGHCLPNVLDMAGVVPYMNEEKLQDACLQFMGGCENVAGEMLEQDFELLRDAETLGSIMVFNNDKDYLAMLRYHYEDWTEGGTDDCPDNIKALLPGVRIILALTEKYHALVMNPPYMGGGKMNAVLSKYVKEHYEEGKADLFSVFMMMGMEHLVFGGKMAQINMQSWMFLSSFERMRDIFLHNYLIESMLHLGPRTFDELSGEVVQNTAFVLTNPHRTKVGEMMDYELQALPLEERKAVVAKMIEEVEDGSFNRMIREAKGTYYRLVDGKNCADKEQLFLSHIHGNEDCNRVYYPNVEQKNFEKIPGKPIGYWVSEKMIEAFENKRLETFASPKQGLATGNNDLFLKFIWEISKDRRCCKWFPCTKGGGFRKWYGNIFYCVDWADDGYEIKNYRNENGKLASRPQNQGFYFKQKGCTWSTIASGKPSFRYFSKKWLFETKGSVCFPKDENQNNVLMGYLNSPLVYSFLSIFSPTLDYHEGPIGRLPYIEINNSVLDSLVQQNISISKSDWDAHETSWDFQRNELLAIGDAVSHCTNNKSLNERLCGETPQLLKFVNKKEYIYINGNKLPHWNQSDCVQFVTFRLADSLPQAKLMEYKQIKDEWLANHPKPWDEATQEEYNNTIGYKIDKWLDAGHGSCMLKDEKVRKIVEDSILHFNGEKYNIHAYVIMPNHVHVLLSPVGDNPVQSIVGSWKKFSAHEINKMLNQTGSVWERESFDRMVRNDEDFEAKFNYIEANPKNLPSSFYTLGGAVSHCTIDNNAASLCCGETPQLLLKDLVEAYKQKWERKFMQLHENEEELNRQFIHIYGLEDELTPDVPLDEITILQQGEISIAEQ